MQADDVDVILAQARILIPPKARVDAFDDITYHLHLLSENEDNTNCSVVREVDLKLRKIQLVPVENTPLWELIKHNFEGQAQQYLEGQLPRLNVMRSSWHLFKEKVNYWPVGGPIAMAEERVRQRITFRDSIFDCMMVVLDSGWEVSAAYFALWALSNADFSGLLPSASR